MQNFTSSKVIVYDQKNNKRKKTPKTVKEKSNDIKLSDISSTDEKNKKAVIMLKNYIFQTNNSMNLQKPSLKIIANNVFLLFFLIIF